MQKMGVKVGKVLSFYIIEIIKNDRTVEREISVETEFRKQKVTVLN